jgi:hypothetical protein
MEHSFSRCPDKKGFIFDNPNKGNALTLLAIVSSAG